MNPPDSPAPIVFFDIAGPDTDTLANFYFSVFGWRRSADGNMNVNVSMPLRGTLRRDPAEKLLYVGVPDIDAALAAIVANAGSIDAPRCVVPGVVILALFKDPAGNRMGLVEMVGDTAKVP